MYNILLTDDEQIMVDSLTFIIEKNFPSQTRIFSSLSGSQALEITAKEQIDIIFMDINMPGLNGLETVKYILQSKPDTVIVILSAFDKFQYAQEAVNLGVYRYLTKPVNRNTVVETLRNAMNMVDQKRGRKTNEVELHKKLDLVSPMVESDFIYSAAFGGAKDVSDYFSYFGISASVWCFCCLEIPKVNESNQYEIYDKIREIMTHRVKCIIGSFMMNRLVVFFSFPLEADIAQVSADAKNCITSIYNILCINIGSGIRAGVSSFQTDSSLTGESYNEALEVLNGVPLDKGGIQFALNVKESKSRRGASNCGAVAENIFGRIRAGDSASINALVSSYGKALYEKYNGDLNKIKNSFFELLVNVRNITTEIDTAYQNDEFTGAFSFLSSSEDLPSIVSFVRKRCEECAVDVMQVSFRKSNPIIDKAEEYIVQHISGLLSLEEVAQAVDVSSFYLSKLFKEVKGENYITYITDMRMQKAKELLNNPRSVIKEVSAAVGFNDQNYFSRIFRNKFGMTPTEFRNAVKEKN